MLIILQYLLLLIAYKLHGKHNMALLQPIIIYPLTMRTLKFLGLSFRNSYKNVHLTNQC